MPRSLRKSMRLATAAAASAVLSISAFAGTANASSHPSASPRKNESCIIRLAPPTTRHSAAREVSRTCAPTAAALKASGIEPGYIIFTVYQYTEYKGQHLQFSATAPCSSSQSWDINDVRPSDHGMDWGASSWKAGNSCWNTTIYYGTDETGSYYTYQQGVYEAAEIGSGFDNHVWSAFERYSG